MKNPFYQFFVCPWCHKEYDRPFVNFKTKVIDGEFAFHVSDTHGVPPMALEWMFDTALETVGAGK